MLQLWEKKLAPPPPKKKSLCNPFGRHNRAFFSGKLLSMLVLKLFRTGGWCNPQGWKDLLPLWREASLRCTGSWVREDQTRLKIPLRVSQIPGWLLIPVKRRSKNLKPSNFAICLAWQKSQNPALAHKNSISGGVSKGSRSPKKSQSSNASRGAPDGVATLKVRKGAFDALNKGSGALDQWSKAVKQSCRPLRDAPWRTLWVKSEFPETKESNFSDSQCLQKTCFWFFLGDRSAGTPRRLPLRLYWLSEQGRVLPLSGRGIATPTVSRDSTMEISWNLLSLASTLFLHSVHTARSRLRACPWFSDVQFPLSFSKLKGPNPLSLESLKGPFMRLGIYLEEIQSIVKTWTHRNPNFVRTECLQLNNNNLLIWGSL